MPKSNSATLVGIDVSAKELTVVAERPTGKVENFVITNTQDGHRRLIKRLTARGRQARVALEASGIYSLDLAFALHRADRIEVTVVNPRAARDFAKASMHRSKNDTVDAAVLLEFVRRMPFRQWEPPSTEALELRALARRIGALTRDRPKEMNRLHAARHTQELTKLVQNDIEVNIRHLSRRIRRLEERAVDLIWENPWLRKSFAHLTSIRGIGRTSGVQILGEVSVLPQDMTPRQWVAHAGLDPRTHESGQAVHRPPRISRVGNKRLRAALYMPALTAIRCEPHVKAFYQKLIGREKAPLQAVVAVMRKLLHSIHGMLNSGTDFEGPRFYALGA